MTKRPARFLAAFLGVSLVASACDNPFAPKRSGPAPLAFGSVAEGDVSRGGTRSFRLPVHAGQLFVVYLDATGDSVVLRMSDPRGAPVVVVRHNGRAPEAGWHPPVQADADGEYRIEVTTPAGSNGAEFTLAPTLVLPAPEQAAAIVQLQDTIDERIDHPTDLDEFIVELQADQEVNVFLQKPGTGGLLLATVMRPPIPGVPAEANGIAAAWVEEVATDELEARATGNFRAPVAGTYRIRVENAAGRLPYTGAYRLQVRAIDRGPERAGALVVGDTLAGEAIDHVGDVDEYVLRGAPGAQYNVYLEGTGAPPHTARVSVLAGTTLLRQSTSRESDGHLLRNPAGTFTMPAAGDVMLRVDGTQNRFGLFRGAYRLLVQQIDSAPETPVPALPSAVPFTGAIEPHGDVDDYHFVLASASEVGVLARPEGPPISSVLARVVDAAGVVRQPGLLPAGSYRLRVSAHGSGTRETYRGPYEAVLAVAQPAPETAATDLALGDTVRVEASAWPVDVDRFTLRSAGTDTLRLYLRREPADSMWTRTVTISDAATGDLVLSDAQAWSKLRLPAVRLDMAPGATYTVSIQATTRHWAPGTASPYVLAVERASSAPESAAAVHVGGDTVREAIDFPGDIDVFTIRGTPGQRVTLRTEFPVTNFSPVFFVSVIDPAIGNVLAESSDEIYTGHTPPVAFPASGELRVRVCAADEFSRECRVPEVCGPSAWAHLCPDGSVPVRPYSFVIHSVDPQPERRSSAFAVGDTVSGMLEHPFDVDEFTFQAAAGDRIVLQAQWLTDLFTEYENTWQSGIMLTLVDGTTRKGVIGLQVLELDPELELNFAGPLLLPSTGTYIVRVSTNYDQDYGAYRFRVIRAPAP